jgi:hypothetical protein
MKATVTVVTLFLLAAAGAQASDVYRTTDAQGRPIYTDKPPTLPAQKLDVRTSATDAGEVQQRYDEQMQRTSEADKARAEAGKQATEAKKAAVLTAEDQAKRCQDARQRYESYMKARRLYQPGATEGERDYLSDAELDAARADAKQLMDEFCGGQ